MEWLMRTAIYGSGYYTMHGVARRGREENMFFSDAKRKGKSQHRKLEMMFKQRQQTG